jgi:hypothetical protein
VDPVIFARSLKSWPSRVPKLKTFMVSDAAFREKWGPSVFREFSVLVTGLSTDELHWDGRVWPSSGLLRACRSTS